MLHTMVFYVHTCLYVFAETVDVSKIFSEEEFLARISISYIPMMNEELCVELCADTCSSLSRSSLKDMGKRNRGKEI